MGSSKLLDVFNMFEMFAGVLVHTHIILLYRVSILGFHRGCFDCRKDVEEYRDEDII
jgi:hypothetical protein